jgi:hypothetical protein
MITTATDEAPTPETTDLERRVLAHERILQAFIAYMSRTEPRFIDHLSERFVDPMSMAAHEHDHRETDDYAEEFVRAVILLGESEHPSQVAPWMRRSAPAPRDRSGATAPLDPPARDERVKVRERSGVWTVTVDGVFKGDYHREGPARAAAALAKLVIRG